MALDPSGMALGGDQDGALGGATRSRREKKWASSSGFSALRRPPRREDEEAVFQLV